jgi:hypothetical protein
VESRINCELTNSIVRKICFKGAHRCISHEISDQNHLILLFCCLVLEFLLDLRLEFLCFRFHTVTRNICITQSRRANQLQALMDAILVPSLVVCAPSLHSACLRSYRVFGPRDRVPTWRFSAKMRNATSGQRLSKAANTYVQLSKI